MSLTIQREADLSDHTVMFVVTGREGVKFEVHCDRCGEFVVYETEVDARRSGTRCPQCDHCERCNDTGEVCAGDLYDEASYSGACQDIACPDCDGPE